MVARAVINQQKTNKTQTISVVLWKTSQELIDFFMFKDKMGRNMLV